MSRNKVLGRKDYVAIVKKFRLDRPPFLEMYTVLDFTGKKDDKRTRTGT